MSEREIRDLLHRLCGDINRRARALGRSVKKGAVPFALGAGLALSVGACSDDSVALYGVPPVEAGVDGNQDTDGPAPAYMGPFEAGVDTTTPADMGPAPAYQAPPTEAGPQPDYMAPDAGPQPDYMAPDGSA